MITLPARHTVSLSTSAVDLVTFEMVDASSTLARLAVVDELNNDVDQRRQSSETNETDLVEVFGILRVISGY